MSCTEKLMENAKKIQKPFIRILLTPYWGCGKWNAFWSIACSLSCSLRDLNVFSCKFNAYESIYIYVKIPSSSNRPNFEIVVFINFYQTYEKSDFFIRNRGFGWVLLLLFSIIIVVIKFIKSFLKLLYY